MRRCTLVCDSARRPIWVELELPDVPVTLAGVLSLARHHPLLHGLEVDWDTASTGIWGRERPRSALVRDGDRVELYRPLPHDPRQARRARATQARRASGTVK
jgi:putative ubiquitin-RnfH superfamily antitoxin RatB of RatAB toxin-antitoxin module